MGQGIYYSLTMGVTREVKSGRRRKNWKIIVRATNKPEALVSVGKLDL